MHRSPSFAESVLGLWYSRRPSGNCQLFASSSHAAFIALVLFLLEISPVLGQSPEWQLPAPVVNSTTPYNFHFVVTEEFLNRFVARDEMEPGKVDDFVFGAKVDGNQWSKTQLRLDLRPSAEKAHATFVLTGQVETSTIGRTEQGAVQTRGHQEFRASKDIYFNGIEFTTRHATVMARATNEPVAAFTRLDGTILQSLGRKVAMSRAVQQRPQAEAYARDKVVENVFPKFDGTIDGQLATANDQLEQQIKTGLESLKLLPSDQRLSTTDQHLHYASWVGTVDSRTAIAVPQVRLAGPHAVTVYLHESLPNGLIDRLQLQGKKTTDRELKQIFERLAKAVTAHLPSLEDLEVPDNPGSLMPGLPVMLVTEIEFDTVRPLELRFGLGEMVIEIRATFRPAGQQLLPPLLVKVPLRLDHSPEGWKLMHGDIDLQSTSTEPLPDSAQTLILDALKSRLRPVSVPERMNIPVWPPAVPQLRLTEARSAVGWVAISFD